jgi:V/A-type H+-transporting ATPase subunit I
VVVGTVLLIAMEGPIGLLTGPLELMGLVGNVLSYLRIAAIGIASVYLARVANELGALGPIWLGVIIAGLFHSLNLVLGVFSPTIQALRLHYVEFFGKFYQGDGTPFQPFGSLERKE